MRQADSNQNRKTTLSRRSYAQLLAGASIAGLAGCSGGDDDGGDGSDENNSDGSDGSDGEDGSDGGSGEPVADRLAVVANNFPEQSNLNPWAANEEAGGAQFLEDFSAPGQKQTYEPRLSGHGWEMSWSEDHEEASIPTMITDYEVEPPYDIYESLNEDLTYWDGTPIDAHARVKHEFIQFCVDGLLFDDSYEFNYEAQDQWTLHWWRQEDNPGNEAVLESEAAPPSAIPAHPDFTTPYVERLEAAEDQEEVEDIVADLEADNISFNRLAEQEWGSGIYQADPDQISQERLIATLRDDHPNEHAAIPELEIKFADTDRQDVLLGDGQIDVLWGMIQEDGRLTRDALPDYIQELEQYIIPNGDQVMFNWNNPHLQNLWVRRAIVAAVDWYTVAENGWGAASSVPVQHHVGLPDGVAENVFSEEFLDSLYQYPIEADQELAEEWLQRGGYTKSGGNWVSPDGEELQLLLNTTSDIPEYRPASETISAHLSSMGITSDYETTDFSSWADLQAPENTNFEMSVFWGGGPDAWSTYASENGGSQWVAALMGGDPTTNPPTDYDPDDYGETDNYGKPFDVQIPNEVGSIEAPDEAGRNPDLSDAEEISLPKVTRSLVKPDVDEEIFQENLRKCARYYNFYVPSFLFHQLVEGVVGNVRDFSFPPEDHEAYHASKDGHQSDTYLVDAGLIQNKYDTDYPEPDN